MTEYGANYFVYKVPILKRIIVGEYINYLKIKKSNIIYTNHPLTGVKRELSSYYTEVFTKIRPIPWLGQIAYLLTEIFVTLYLTMTDNQEW